MKTHPRILRIFAAGKKCFMRKYWVDNLRWVTVMLVLLYHVIYFYNNKGVFGGVGGFGDGPQYQDVLMYILYPWFMPLLFILAGISAKYALDRHSGKEWFKSRTLKLLVPSTIGLFVFHWMEGYFNTHVGGTDVLASVPQPLKFCVWAVSGTGPLWFIQDLWLFSLILLLIRRITRDWHFKIKNKKVKKHFHDYEYWYLPKIMLFGICVLYWLGGQTLIFNPRPESADGLYNLYKPLFYLIFFLLGYYCFSSKKIQKYLSDGWWIDMACAIVACVYLLFDTYGENNTTPHCQIRQDKRLCRIYDPLQFWHLHRSLSGDCQPWLYDESLYSATASGTVPYSYYSGFHPVATNLRNRPSDSVCAVVRAGGEEKSQNEHPITVLQTTEP